MVCRALRLPVRTVMVLQFYKGDFKSWGRYLEILKHQVMQL